MILAASAPLIPDGDEARRLAERELADPSYRAAEPTPFDRIARAIGDGIAKLFTGDVDAAWAPLVAIGALLLVVLLVVLAVVIWGRPRSRSLVRADRGELFGDAVTAGAGELRRTAAALADQGDWEAATVAAVRALARGLEEQQRVRVAPGATVTSFARSAGAVFPDEAASLIESAHDFDDVRYLHRPGSRDAYERVRALDDRLSRTRVTR
ncbi:DUF4129 domain-containing protein [Microbacterium binotii]|uniref:DUF4129 domain-containing protein n=1 Tax=Microbacterium binotii TaxID=462710 RepID=UPI001F24A73A|nr:DUF4129 domain-containing protein [Microbacterium binotii]UIN29841.1 DUF4129 domain-containing protein [Microbacterium binotii]